MSLPTWNLSNLAPSFVDGLQYPAGTHTNESGWIGSFVTAVPYVEPSGAHQYGAPLEVISAGWVWRSEPWPANQFAVYQTIVPLDGASGSSVGVRMGPGGFGGNAIGYTMHNVGYTSNGEWLFVLSRTTATSSVPLAYWDHPDGGNADGSFVILECADVAGGVAIRASVAYSPWGGIGYTIETEGPHDFPAEIVGDPVLLGTVVDTSAVRIRSGSPGFGGNFYNPSGGCYGFSAGEVYVLSASAGTPSGGTVTLSGLRVPGSTITVTRR